MSGLISFSLWGENPRYLVGAERNADLAPRWYPGWRCRFYVGASVPGETRRALSRHAHVELVERPERGDWTGLFWRFLAAGDPDAEAVVFRDTDSRLGRRERLAVDEWLESGRPAHLMRDHPWHGAPVLGGMWGVRRGVLSDIGTLVDAWPRADYWQNDQEFLAAEIAPRLCGKWLEHDEYFGGRPFPALRAGREYVGEPFDEHDRSLIDGPGIAVRLTRRLGGKALRAVGLRSPLLRCPS